MVVLLSTMFALLFAMKLMRQITAATLIGVCSTRGEAHVDLVDLLRVPVPVVDLDLVVFN